MSGTKSNYRGFAVFLLSVVAGALVVVLGFAWATRPTLQPKFGKSLDEVPGMMTGELARPMALASLAGGAVKLFDSASDGASVVLCFTSRACPGCAKEAEVWRRLMAAGKAGHVRAYIVSADSKTAEVDQYAKALGLRDLPVLYDPHGKVYEHFKLQLLPQYLVFDSHGKLLRREMGYSEVLGIRPEDRTRTLLNAAGVTALAAANQPARR